MDIQNKKTRFLYKKKGNYTITGNIAIIINNINILLT